MNKPLLSICVPTYNRVAFLRQCLTSIFNQPLSGEIEVMVSDNGSIDQTRELIEEFQSQHHNLSYFKNETNLGFDKNVLQVVEKGQGQYCWLLGDDDALFEDALAFLLPLLSEKKYDYLLANTWGYDRELAKPALSRSNSRISSNKFYPSLKDFVREIRDPWEMVGTFGGMSAQIFKREVWQALLGKEEYIGSQTVHLHVILKAFKDLPTLVIAKPLVKTRADNMRWDTFPGLESIYKRHKVTREGMLWIFNLYHIPYSKFGLQAKYYGRILYSLAVGFAKRTLFKNRAMRNLAKKVLGK